MKLESRIKRIPFVKYYSMIILILLLLAALASGLSRLISYYNKRKNYEFIITESGNNIKTIELADRTIVYLNRDSKLIYRSSFNKTDRELILEGEAYFEVENTNMLPFVVFTDKSSVMVRRTRFNIKEERDNIVVTVISGVIAFYETENSSNRIELGPNQSASYDKKTNEIRILNVYP
jgi:transmembrane sensor